MDITELILFQHHEQRRAFSLLDEVDHDDGDRLGALWGRLAILLEVHAESEERYFYPRLLELGTGGGGQPSAGAETKDAIKDHNEIRDAVREVGQHRPGTDAWWGAVAKVRQVNGDHMAEEEREDLPDFRSHADLATRHSIAVQFVVFEAKHALGIEAIDKDPTRYVQSGGDERAAR